MLQLVNCIEDNARPTLAPGVRLQIDRTTSEPVLLFPEGLMQLNASAQAILARCDGRSTTAEIVSSLAAEYEADEAELRKDVIDCLNTLHNRKLLVLFQ